ncbi:IPT/TIG domain-containing protein [Actinoplanes sp. NPDC049596]|uniref:beta strand repeat-containing protein n=1 Tax=unclassified Actinoplanes TaxID=2626549 RepID=UPI00341FD0BE
MRTFHARTRRRLLGAGFATAVTAAAVAMVPAPAFAANAALTIAPSAGPVTGTLTISATNFLTGVSTPAAYFDTTNSCSGGTAAYGSPPGTAKVAAITKTNDSTATVTLPTGGGALTLTGNQATPWYLCVFVGTGSTDLVVGSGTYTAVPTSAAVTGGLNGPVNISSAGAFTGIANPAAYFSATACPATYGTPPATVATLERTSDDAVVLTPGTGAASLAFNSGANRAYNACVYTSSSAGAALALSSTFNLSATATPVAGPPSGAITVTSNGTFTNIASPVAVFSPTSCPANYSASGNTVGTVTRTSEDQISVAVPTTLALNSGAFKAYTLCVYPGTTASSALLMSSPYRVAPAATTVTPTTGASGAGGTMTVTFPSTSAILSGSTYYVGFASNGCPASYADITATRQSQDVNKVSTTQLTATIPAGVGGVNNQTFNACVYSANSGENLVGTTSLTAYTVTLGTASLSQTVGAGSGVNVTMTSNNANALTTSTAPAAVFFKQSSATAPYCPGSYTVTGGTAAQNTRKLTSSKASIQFPSSPLASGAWSVCLYNNGTDGKLLASATYTVAAVPRILSVSPAQGPALGGNTITVTGANLPATAGSITVTIGNTPVENSKITPLDATSFTFVAPAHSMGSSSIVIKTDIGTDTLPGAYNYVNSLVVTPNSAAVTVGQVSLDIFGTNFKDYVFADTANTSAHVYLVKGSYEAAAATQAGGSTNRNNVKAVADCLGVLVINDNELVCTMDLRKSLLATGALFGSFSAYRASATVVTSSSSNIMTSTSPIFTQADVGKTVTAALVGPAGSTGTNRITEVIDGYSVVLAGVPSGTPTTVAIGSTNSPTVVATTANATTLTYASGGTQFTQADVGRHITESGNGTKIPEGTYITGVNDAGTVITLSNPVAAGLTTPIISSSAAVPPGAYNVQLVSNAAAGATPTVSVLSSGSTFTVAPF